MYALPSHQQDGQPSGQFTQDRSSGANEGWPPYKKEITNWGGPIEPVEIPDSSISRTATSSHPSSWQTSRSPAGFIAPRDQYVQRQSQTHVDRYERRPSPSLDASRPAPHYDDRGQQAQPQTVRPRSPPRVYEDRAATPRHSSSRFASESYGGPAAVDDEGWPAPKKEIRGFTSEIEDHLSSDLANQRKASSVISSTYSSGWKTTQPSTAPQATRQDGTESYATNGRPERPSSQTKSHTAQTPRYVNGAGSLQNGRSDRGIYEKSRRFLSLTSTPLSAQPSSSEGPPISLREYLATEHRQMLGEAPSKANGHEQDKGTRTPTKDVRSPGASQRIEIIEDGDTSLRPSESASNIGSGSSYEDAADADGWKEYAPGQRTQWRTGKFADDQAVEGPEGVYTYKAQHAEDDDMPLLHRQTERHTPEQHGRVAEESHKRRSSVNAPTPKRWDSVGQNAVDGLERAATPRASQSTISPSIERSEPKANELSIKGVSRHLDETQALKDENAALKARLKVLEERHAAPTANEADADRIAALQRDNVALLSELEYFRASRHAASKLLSPLLQLLAPNGFRVDTKEP